MKKIICRAVLLLLCCSSLQMAMAQEFRSGLLLVSKHNQKRTRVIPINRKVKIWAGETNKVYRAKILAVDSTYAYLSLGTRIPIKSINRIRRNRIMLRDVGRATVFTGVVSGVAGLESSSDIDSDADVLQELTGGLFLSVFSAIGVGITTLTAGTVIGAFEPRYQAEKWNIEPLNPEEEVVFQNYILNEKMNRSVIEIH